MHCEFERALENDGWVARADKKGKYQKKAEIAPKHTCEWWNNQTNGKVLGKLGKKQQKLENRCVMFIKLPGWVFTDNINDERNA